MTILLITLWLLCGVICVWRLYHGDLKSWYYKFGESYWDFDKRNNGNSAIRLVLYLSPLFILMGVISLIVSELDNKTNNTWWFTTKNKENEKSFN